MQHPKIRRRPAINGQLTVIPALTIVASLLSGGCANNTSVSSTWHEQSRQNRAFAKVVIVGATDNADKRLSFEDAVVADLRSTGTVAWASMRLMQTDAPIDENNLQQLVEKTGAEAIIITTVSSLDVQAVESGGQR